MNLKLHIPADLAAVAMTLYARPAAACAACFAASNAGTRLGYVVSTAILTLTPVFIMGVMAAYVAVKYSRAARQEDRASGAG